MTPSQPGVTRGVRGHRPDPTSLVYHRSVIYQALTGVTASAISDLDAFFENQKRSNESSSEKSGVL